MAGRALDASIHDRGRVAVVDTYDLRGERLGCRADHNAAGERERDSMANREVAEEFVRIWQGQAVTVADIQRAARQYLRADTAWRGVSVSDNPVAPPAAAQ